MRIVLPALLLAALVPAVGEAHPAAPHHLGSTSSARPMSTTPPPPRPMTTSQSVLSPTKVFKSAIWTPMRPALATTTIPPKIAKSLPLLGGKTTAASALKKTSTVKDTTKKLRSSPLTLAGPKRRR